jgi:hypothetical protein
MGYVRARKKVGPNWDAHIVFRGSRSGYIYHGMIREGIPKQLKGELTQINGNGKRIPLAELEQPPWAAYSNLYKMVNGDASTRKKMRTSSLINPCTRCSSATSSNNTSTSSSS